MTMIDWVKIDKTLVQERIKSLDFIRINIGRGDSFLALEPCTYTVARRCA